MLPGMIPPPALRLFETFPHEEGTEMRGCSCCPAARNAVVRSFPMKRGLKWDTILDEGET
jgi:hypothetical protein